MKNVEYTYKIINVDPAAKSMEIVYESPEYGVLHVGARLPWKGETVEQVVQTHNPSVYWLEQNRKVQVVEENISGSLVSQVVDPDEELPPPTPEKLKAIVERNRQRDYELEADPIYFKVQRGEALIDEWYAKVEEIKSRWPYPEMTT